MDQDLQLSFRALGDPTRRQILQQLTTNDMTITEVVDQFDLTRTAVRKHLSILEEGHLITVTKSGKERINRLNPQGLKNTAQWFSYFDQFWDSALKSLTHAVESSHKNQTKR